jgi:hypothetical protein
MKDGDFVRVVATKSKEMRKKDKRRRKDSVIGEKLANHRFTQFFACHAKHFFSFVSLSSH